jgi:hypothetical protein
VSSIGGSRKGAKAQRKKEKRLLRQAIHDSLYAILDQFDIEVDQQTEAEVHEAKMSQQLLLVYVGEFFHGFDLHDHLAFDDQIRSEANVDLNPS